MELNKEIASLREHIDALENYFRNTIIPQLFIDVNLILRKFTPAAMKQFSLSSSDLGKSIHNVVNNLRFPSVIQNIHQVIKSREILEKEIQTTDLRWYQMNIIPYIEQRDNKANGVIITFVEITRRIKELQEQEKLVAEHETLLDSISHDIKNSLTNLSLSVNLLTDSEDEIPQPLKPYVQHIDKSVRKLQDIVKDLVESRMDKAHKYMPDKELLNLENILEDVNLTLVDAITASGAVITTEINVSEIEFPRKKIRSIIYNLVSNAIKYKSPDRKPEIFIRTVKENDVTIFSIKDNGIGMDAAKQDKIFKKYYRIDTSIEGTGIGLFLVKELVTSEGGQITVNSHRDKGTEFKVYLKV